jgi:hypothetical protein
VYDCGPPIPTEAKNVMPDRDVAIYWNPKLEEKLDKIATVILRVYSRSDYPLVRRFFANLRGRWSRDYLSM